MRSQTEVGSPSERVVLAILEQGTIEAELVRTLRGITVAIGRTEQVHDLGVGRDLDAMNGDGLVVGAAVAEHRGVEAQALLDGVGNERRFGDEPLPAATVFEQAPDG